MQGVFFLSGLLAYSPVRGAFSERTLQFRFTTHAERAKSLLRIRLGKWGEQRGRAFGTPTPWLVLNR